MRSRIVPAALAGLIGVVFAGCGGPVQPEFPALYAVTGYVVQNGEPVAGGTVRFTLQPSQPEFLTTAVVGADGTFTLSTVRTTDKSGERRAGAGVGLYKVTYFPPGGDQTAGQTATPIDLPMSVAVRAEPVKVKIELPAR